MTYAQFHLVFLLPALLLAAFAAIPALRAHRTTIVIGLCLMTGVAVVYTTPWDAYLVREAIWWYGEDRVLATWLGVPIEEYAFFVLQTFLMGLVVSAALYRAGRIGRLDAGGPFSSAPGEARVRWIGTLIALTLTTLGVASLQRDSTRYLGLILAWSGPILTLLWSLGGPRLWSLRSVLLPPIVGVTAYLWIADRAAIEWDIWTISSQFTVGWVPLGLPVEEALFFVVTNLMVSLGLTLFVLGSVHLGWTGQARPIESAELSGVGQE